MARSQRIFEISLSRWWAYSATFFLLRSGPAISPFFCMVSQGYSIVALTTKFVSSGGNIMSVKRAQSLSVLTQRDDRLVFAAYLGNIFKKATYQIRSQLLQHRRINHLGNLGSLNASPKWYTGSGISSFFKMPYNVADELDMTGNFISLSKVSAIPNIQLNIHVTNTQSILCTDLTAFFTK